MPKTRPAPKRITKPAPKADLGSDIQEWINKQVTHIKNAGQAIESDLSRRGQAFLDNTKFDEGFALMKGVMTKKKRK